MKHKICSVTWVDSCSLGGWQRREGNHGLSRIDSIGYIIRETRTEITITSSISQDSGNVMDALTIPKVAIVRRKNRR